MIAPISRAALAGSAFLLLIRSALAAAGSWSDARAVDNYVIRLGLPPAEMIPGHPAQHVERAMRGGASGGDYHVMITLLNAKTGARTAPTLP